MSPLSIPDSPSAGVGAVPLVHIIDDDDALRDSLAFLLQSVGIEALVYPTATAFLEEFDPKEPAVVVVDIRMPGLSGFQLQDQLMSIGYPAPVVFCSAHGDIPTSVRAMRHGAVDFLEKPYDPHRMLELLQRHLASSANRFVEHEARREVAERVSDLTPREREVLRLAVNGLPSQRIAQILGASVKTVDVHRARIKSKTGASSLGALTRDILLHRVAV
ncbi:response regulator [Paenarthrobacter nitroguajacolicus]|uniref:response regulator transcription factor n=1 Tax=Paenarthrobacter nitroguajacolicus TaxID=211146 RepID=UPI00285EAC7E|nr:response regulator [Paenarthrobacter nitroguajacolicus]MDR6637036.1 FixJ family two-component response regulator [Paenarthrobacter nitroguajacolicus]